VDFQFVRGADGTQLMKFDENKCIAKYAYYFLTSVEVHNTGKYERHYKYVKNIMMPIPPLEIQKKIVQECEKIDNRISKISTSNDSLRDKISAIVDSMHEKGYTEKTIQELSTSTQYGTSKKSQKEGDVPVIRMGNIQSGKIDWTDLVYTCDEEDIKKYELRKNDVLFNRTNSPVHVGKTGIYKGEQKAIYAGYLIRIEYIPELIDPDYLCYILNSKKIRNYGFSVMKKSNNQANINSELLKQYKIPVPPLDEQKKVVKKIINLEKQIQAGNEEINSLIGEKNNYIKNELNE
ncbi:MAG: restriction endonuclease subunit S, partial [Acetatifactor sp.]|nr:restriction endonuclease subunit S [Acetatifactor sp.]